MTLCSLPLRAAVCLVLLAGPVLLSQGDAERPRLPPRATGKVDFTREVRPLFASRCYSCHGSRRQSGGLGLHRRDRALAGGDSGAAIVPGKSDRSRLIRYVAGLDEDHVMPPPGKGERLSAKEVGRLRAWIDQGARWPDEADRLSASEHWGYRKPVRPPLPPVKDGAWCRNGIDRFVLARLEREGLAPSPAADRPALIRRVSLDLVGLPPTVDEVDAFVNDPRPDAYERLVDGLLASPRYGERWARPWLDLARYADTNGYEKDRPRSIWPWRDWVIGALNADMPFDQFTVEQFAGDLLPPSPLPLSPSEGERGRGEGATLAQKVATGFHRNSMLNDEGGINPEEFRVVAVKDRVDTTATAWLGTTLECAQCHSHKYDPFTQEEYYRFLAFFNQTADSGVGNGPEIPVPTSAEKARLDRVAAELAALDGRLKEHEGRLGDAQAKWEQGLLSRPRADTPLPEGLYLHYPLRGGSKEFVEDASGNGRDAEVKGGGATWGGLAVRLEKGSHLDAGNVGDFDRGQKFSYGCWVKPETLDGGLLSRIDDPNAYRGYDLFFYQKRFEVHLSHHWPENALKVKTERTFEAGRWHHVFATCDGSGRAAGVRIYVDGKAERLTVENDRLKDTIRTGVSFKVGKRHVAGAFTGFLADVRVYDRQLTAAEVAVLTARHPVLEAVRVPRAKRTKEQQAELAAFFRDLDPGVKKIKDEIAAKMAAMLNVRSPTTMVLQEVAKPRPNYVMLRGDFRQKGKAVEPGTPDVLHPFPAGAPRNRLGLARWLVSRDNPLVGRVTVNRHWQAFFGRGLVPTPEDFGTQGDPPTYPELLDWLAVELPDPASGGVHPRRWSMKALHRLIVTSATYRQSSRVAPEVLRRDPYNVLHARGPRLRVEYETLRDLALSAGGLLSQKIGGPSVMPPQPPGVWENSFGFYDLPDFRWKDATGEDRYRRGIYTFLRRSALYPAFKLFDAPSREVCSVRRPRTNTPLQALATLNDPVFVEAACGLARRILVEAKGDAKARAAWAFRVCVSRQPQPVEVEKLAALYEKALTRYRAGPKAAAALVKYGRVGADGIRGEELAAWAVIANVLLNLDETLTKG